MAPRTAIGEGRTAEQLRQHYLVERELADRLRRADKRERGALYASLYDELYRRVPDHPQLTRKRSAAESALSAAAQIQFLRPFLKADTSYLEVGPGDCALAFAVARSVRQVYAVDVSAAITAAAQTPLNFQLLLSDGVSIPVPAGSVSLAYSNQLMEHLHPDDAFEQLSQIYKALAPGGRYICITPNRLNGPHDISKYFDTSATGFHMKEYTIGELRALFRQVGFATAAVYVGGKGVYRPLPLTALTAVERALSAVPARQRRRLANTRVLSVLLNCRFVGTK